MPELLHRRILVTRPRGQASALADLLTAEGAEVISIPTVELVPPSSWCALDAALVSLRSFDWLVFTSANAVHAMTARAQQLRLPIAAKKIAAIGPATAAAVREAGIAGNVDLIPSRFIAESLAEELIPYAPGAAMLLVRAAVARDILPDALMAAGANLTIAEAYQTIVPQSSVRSIRELFSSPHSCPHAITFTSASTAQNLCALVEAAGVVIPMQTVLASIGPVTSQAMRNLGLQPTVEAREASIPALAQCLARYFRR